MKMTDLLVEKYDKKHKCKTPGAIYSVKIHEKKVSIKVEMPKDVDIDVDEDEAVDLEADLHYAVEKVLAKFFK